MSVRMLKSVKCYHLLQQNHSARSRQVTWSHYLPQYNQTSCYLWLFARRGAEGSALLCHLTALPQDAVQAVELAEETAVRDDAPVVLHGLDGVHQRQVLSDHQVGQHQSG